MHLLSVGSPKVTSIMLFCFSLLVFRLVNRELVAWMPDPDDGADASMFSLDEGGPGWDQFAVNESKFGYQTAWNEEHYTVKLDRDK